MHLLPQIITLPLATVDAGSWALLATIVCVLIALSQCCLVGARCAKRRRLKRSSSKDSARRRSSYRRSTQGVWVKVGLGALAVVFLCVTILQSEQSQTTQTHDLQTSTFEPETGDLDNASEDFESRIVFIPELTKPVAPVYEEVAYPSYNGDSTNGFEPKAPSALTSANVEKPSLGNRVQPLANAEESLEESVTPSTDQVVRSRAYRPSERPHASASGYPRVGSVSQTSFNALRQEFSERRHISQPVGSTSAPIQGPVMPTSVDFRSPQNAPTGVENLQEQDGVLVLEKMNEAMYSCYAKVRESVLTLKVAKQVAPGSGRCVDESGSGVIIRYNGKSYLLTNYHIIDGANSKGDVKIDLPNGDQISPINMSVCPDYDLAALEINIDDLLKRQILRPCEIGDCNELREGQFIMALGNPCLLRHSVTMGVVGGLRRDYNDLKNLGVNSVNKLAEFIQLSALINPGNSGGPIYNVRGQVVGIATATLVTNAPTGISFAIPVNDALRITKATIDKGAWLPSKFGVNLAPLSYAEVKNMGFQRQCGARVLGVQSGFPADLAGVKPGDVVISFNDAEVESDLHFARLIALADPDASNRMKVVRDNRLIEIESRFTNGVSSTQLDSRSASGYRQ